MAFETGLNQADADTMGTTLRRPYAAATVEVSEHHPVDLGRQPWSRFAVFLMVTLLLGALQREWLLVSVGVVLLGSVVASALERVDEHGNVGWPTVRRGWPGSYLGLCPAALITGLTGAYLDLPAGLLVPMLGVAVSHLLLAPPDWDQGTPDDVARRR